MYFLLFIAYVYIYFFTVYMTSIFVLGFWYRLWGQGALPNTLCTESKTWHLETVRKGYSNYSFKSSPSAIPM